MPAIIFAFTLPHYFSFRHFIDIDALIELLRRCRALPPADFQMHDRALFHISIQRRFH
jgi:hypothetical protein